jgi:hypothetical protein
MNSLFAVSVKKYLYWKPLNGPDKRGHINRMITITDEFYSIIVRKLDKKESDNIKRLI